MKRAGVMLGLALSACSPRVTLLVDPMDSARCEALCVERIEARYNGQSFELGCGEQVEITSVKPDEPVLLELIATGRGFEHKGQGVLTGSSETSVTEDIVLSPSSRPQITSISVPDVLHYNRAPVTINGTDFGELGPQSMLTIGGEALDLSDPSLALSWSSAQITFETDKTGAVQLHHCGLASNSMPVDFRLFDLALIELETIDLALEDCPNAKLINSDGGESNHETDIALGVFRCGNGCAHSYAGSLAAEGVPGEGNWEFWRYSRNMNCLWDVAVRREGQLYAGTDAGLARCTPGNNALNCIPLTQGRITDIFVEERAPDDAKRPVYLQDQQAYVWLLISNERRPLNGLLRIDAFGGLWSAGTSSIAEQQLNRWKLQDNASPTLEWSVVLNGCDEAKLVETQHADNTALNGEWHTAVVCAGSNGWLVYGIDRADMSIQGPTQLSGLQGTPTSMAFLLDDLELSNRLRVFIWTDQGTLVLVDLANAQQLDTLQLQNYPEDAIITRTWRSDHFFISGPGPGQLTRFLVPNL